MQIMIKTLMDETQGIHLDKQITLIITEAIIVFLFGRIYSKKKKISKKTLIMIFLFLCYTGILLTLTLFRRPMGMRDGLMFFTFNLGFGFKTGKASVHATTLSIMNILLFVPLGIFGYLAFRRKRLKVTILCSTIIGFTLSFIIECTQLITGRGIFEVTDLVTNTCGCIIGSVMTALIYYVYSALKKQNLNKNGAYHENTNGK